jgi:hypothetical protein
MKRNYNYTMVPYRSINVPLTSLNNRIVFDTKFTRVTTRAEDSRSFYEKNPHIKYEQDMIAKKLEIDRQCGETKVEVSTHAIYEVSKIKKIAETLSKYGRNCDSTTKISLESEALKICHELGKYYLSQAKNSNSAYEDTRKEWVNLGNKFAQYTSIYDYMRDEGIMPNIPYMMPSAQKFNDEITKINVKTTNIHNTIKTLAETLKIRLDLDPATKSSLESEFVEICHSLGKYYLSIAKNKKLAEIKLQEIGKEPIKMGEKWIELGNKFSKYGSVYDYMRDEGMMPIEEPSSIRLGDSLLMPAQPSEELTFSAKTTHSIPLGGNIQGQQSSGELTFSAKTTHSIPLGGNIQGQQPSEELTFSAKTTYSIPLYGNMPVESEVLDSHLPLLGLGAENESM